MSYENARSGCRCELEMCYVSRQLVRWRRSAKGKRSGVKSSSAGIAWSYIYIQLKQGIGLGSADIEKVEKCAGIAYRAK